MGWADHAGITFFTLQTMANYTGTTDNDWLKAYEINQQLYGLLGNDTLVGGMGNVLLGGDGNDSLIATHGDVLLGGSGFNTAYFGASVSADELTDIELQQIQSIVITSTGGGRFDFSTQTESLDILGGNGNDTLLGGYSSDTLRGGAGNDLLQAQDIDVIEGGTGQDTVRFDAGVSASQLLDADLAGVESIEITCSASASYDFSLQSEALSITGTAFDDTLIGGLAADSIVGGSGDDLLLVQDTDLKIDGGAHGSLALGGGDTARFVSAVSATHLLDADLVGIERIELAFGAAASYDFAVQSEALLIEGSIHADTIGGGTGADSITGGNGADSLRGGNGADILDGGDGVDYFDGGDGDDWLVAQDSDALLDGGTGTDTLSLAAAVSASNLADADLVGVERVRISNSSSNASYDFSAQTEGLDIGGGSRNDSIVGTQGADTLSGGGGNDTLTGGNGLDRFNIDAGTDTITDLKAGESLVIDSGATALATGLLDFTRIAVSGAGTLGITGTASGDLVKGSSGQDNVTGGEGNDTLYGIAGNDTLDGGNGIDLLSGGAGNDLLLAQDSDALIDGGPGTDTVRFTTAVTTLNLRDVDLVNVENVELTFVGNAAYDFSVQKEALNITGGSGNDTITGGLGSDAVLGGSGDDLLIANARDSLIDGGDGDDTVRYGAAVASLVDGDLINVEFVVITNAGNAIYNFSTQTEALNILGGMGRDTILGGSSADTLQGGSGNDLLVARGLGGLALVDGGLGIDTVNVLSAVTELDDSQLLNVEKVVISSADDGLYDFSQQTEALELTGSSQNETIKGGSGIDTLRGGNGNDELWAGDNDRLIDGGIGIKDIAIFTAAVSASNLRDGELMSVEWVQIINPDNASYDFAAQTEGLIIIGGEGNDTITGGKSADVLRGGNGDDVIVAEATDAMIDGGVGSSAGVGGGNDTVQFAAAVSGLTNGQLLYVENVEITNMNSAVYDFSQQLEGLNIVGFMGSDTIRGGTGDDSIDGGMSDDVLAGNAGDDSLSGGLGNDSLEGGAGADMLDGGLGSDVLTVRFASASTRSADSTTLAMDQISNADSDRVHLIDTDTTAVSLALGGNDSSGSITNGVLDLLSQNGVITGITLGDGSSATSLTIGASGSGATDTVDELLTLIDAEYSTDGELVYLTFDLDSYLFVQNGDADVVIKLAGVKGDTTLTLDGGLVGWA